VSAPVARLAPAVEAEPAAELVVVIACHGVVCTIPVRYVERLLGRDEVQVLRPTHRRPAGPEGPLRQLVAAGGEPFAAWNLGTMLDLPPLTAAWVLLRLPGAGEPVGIALRTGPCLVVLPAPPMIRLPAGVIRGRGPGIAGAFATSALGGKRLEAPVGLCLDPVRLFSPAELASSRAAQDAANADPEAWLG
jgi:hypothetical protein